MTALAERKHRFTVADFDAMARDGILPGDQKHELLRGEIFTMPQDGFRHTLWKTAVAKWLFTNINLDIYEITPDETLRLPPDNAPSPDFYVYTRGVALPDLSAKDIALIIEIADTSLATDIGTKARIYAQSGIREYWVVDCENLTVRQYLLNQRGDGYDEPALFSAADTVTATVIDGLSLTLDALNTA